MTVPMMTFGPSLSRKMDPLDAAQLLYMAAEKRPVGMVLIAVVRPHIPNAPVNVEAALDDLTPEQSLYALNVASKQIAKLHGLETPETLALHQSDAGHLRQLAEQLVDRIRSCTFTERLPGFDVRREDAIRELVIALAMAAVTPSRLGKG